jgi:hypothetical protein
VVYGNISQRKNPDLASSNVPKKNLTGHIVIEKAKL